ncbi:hypothetical protein E4T56_gene10220 [Termitomyces sp. T112]|nr:hypothetical protein C0989_000851 [Termitomyces sp. Mn162]KAG5725146.1 hypothetical protein E4T56_gene10220 [Termitomyces sp. T112]
MPPSRRIKRPRNAWLIFRQVKSQEYNKAHPEERLGLSDMSKAMSIEWATASQEERDYFKQLADEEYEDHRAKHPEYKYQPRKKGSGDEPSTVNQGGVTKPRATRKKAASTSATDFAPIHPNVYGGEWPEANPLVPDSNNFSGLGPAVALNNQYAVINSNHTFYDNTIFSPDTFDVSMFHYAAPTMAYSGQPYAGLTQTVMQPFVASQASAYWSGGLMEGYTAAVYNNQPHACNGSLQSFNLYEQTTELDAAAGPSGAYATAYFQNEGGSGYSNPDFTTVDANSLQDLNDFPGYSQEVQYGWAATEASTGLVGV